jgi:hypothetical protein
MQKNIGLILITLKNASRVIDLAEILKAFVNLEYTIYIQSFTMSFFTVSYLPEKRSKVQISYLADIYIFGAKKY